MKKNTLKSVLPACIFCGMLAAMTVVNTLVPQRDFSVMENRPLAKFPEPSGRELRCGQWMKDFESYASDQFLLRDEFMKIKTAADLALLRPDNGRVYLGKDDFLFSTDSLDEERLRINLTLVESVLKKMSLENPKLHTSVLLAPTSRTIAAEKLPANAPVPDERAALDNAGSYLRQSVPGLIFTNPTDVLLQEGPHAYYRTDHHWTTDGAYAAYRLWAKDNGFTPFSRESFSTRTVTEDFLGTHQAKIPGLPIKPDTILRYDLTSGSPNCLVTSYSDITKPEKFTVKQGLYCEDCLSTKDQYSYFLGGNDPQVIIETSVRNGRCLLLVKDSYANGFLPFLALHYEKIIVTDPRYSHGRIIWPDDSALTGPESITDVLFLYNIQSFSTDRNLTYLTQL